ncbi:sulfate reduction electron transfer complex DsrMKJOP subunit DsrJ [Elusimicrobiota bacterium]
MHDTGKILAGLLICIVIALVGSPVLYNAWSGKSAQAPDPKIHTPGEQCVAPTEYMRASHMDLLNTWRDDVVRDGNREYVSPDGREFDKSLSRTCMKCHTNRKEFCTECHDYAGVTPYCWDCHVEPEAAR